MLLKEHYIPNWAKRFNEAGYAAFIYDHRGWGSSDGPRGIVNPQQQAEDYHDAVNFIRTLPGIDSNRIAIWGIGHSGGAAMIAAGDDPHIKAAILMMPYFSGKFDVSHFPNGLLQRALDERATLARDPDARPEYLRVWDDSAGKSAQSESGNLFFHGQQVTRFIDGAKALSEKAGTPWQNRLSLQSFYYLARTEPGDHVHKISPRALLYVTTEIDQLSGGTELQRAIFDKAKEPKEFVALEGDHIGNYSGSAFNLNAEKQIEFLQRYV